MLRRLVLLLGLLLAAQAAIAANDTQWWTSSGATGSRCRGLVDIGQRCYWAWDTPGATAVSPVLAKGCRAVIIRLSGVASPVVHPYTCRSGDPTGANYTSLCDRLEATNQRTGSYTAIVLNDTDEYVRNVRESGLLMNAVSGDSGEVMVECVD